MSRWFLGASSLPAPWFTADKIGKRGFRSQKTPNFKCLEKQCLSRPEKWSWLESAEPLQGQNPQTREKRISGSKNSQGASSLKIPIFLTGYHKENADFWTQSALFRGDWKWEFLNPKPSFPILGILTPVKGQRTRKSKPLFRPRQALFLQAFQSLKNCLD